MRPRALLPFLLLLPFATGAAPAVSVQHGEGLEVLLPPVGRRGTEPPAVRSPGVLSDARTRDLLHHGFPARLHYTLELWSTRGWFDDQLARREWDVVVRYTPLDGRYSITRLDYAGATRIGSFDQLSDVQAMIAGPYRPAFKPPAIRDRMYYNAELDVEMLSVNDLDELERWLRGELQPAARGEHSPGTALTRGVRSLVVRLLGSENRRYRVRSGTFTIANDER